MSVVVSEYDHLRDRDEAISLWSEVFAGDPPWNEPSAMIDQKLRHLPQLFLVARTTERLVATTVGGYDGVRGWMHHVATHPAYRRRGIAQKLVVELEHRLRILGCVKLNLQVREGNNAVVAFYEKLGYRAEPRVSLGKRL